MERSGEPKSTHQERPGTTWNGFIALFLGLAAMACAVWQLIHAVQSASQYGQTGVLGSLVWAVALFLFGALVLSGMFTLQPNEAAILQLFGSYRGTTRIAGLRGCNPFYTRRRISLRSRC